MRPGSKWASTRWARCSPAAKAPTPTRCRSMSAAISIRSRPAASIDGVLGVLGGLEVVRSLNDLGIKTKHPIVVTNWTNEEGARFAPAMLASGVFAGVHRSGLRPMPAPTSRARRFGDELERIGWKGDEQVGDAQDARLLRTAYRAGADPRGRRHRHRRRHPRPGPEMAAGDADRQGERIPARRRCRSAAMPGSAWRG